MNQPDRLQPHSQEFEQVAIGALLLDAKVAYPELVEIVRDDLGVFYDLRHRTIYECVSRMVEGGKPVNLVTVFEQLRLDGQIDGIGGMSYLAGLPDKCASAHGVGYYAEILAEYHQKRQLIALGTDAVSMAFDGVNIQDLIQKTSKGLTDLNRPARSESQSMRELVQAAIGEIEECHQNQGKLPGISTGFPDLDKKTMGLHAGEMFVIAARPSMGKTSLAMNIVEHIAIEQLLPIGVFSLEMTAASLVTRMLCSRARVNLRNVSQGFLTERDFPKLTEAAAKLSKAQIYIDDASSPTIWELKAKAQHWADKHGIKALVIDYLQLIGATNRRDRTRENEVSEMSAGVKSIAKDLGIPVIVLAQLNRALEREGNRRPKMSDLRESGAIEQDADVIAFLWRGGKKSKRRGDTEEDDDDESSDVAPITLTIAKQRNGPKGDVPLTFFKGYTRFESAAKVELPLV